MNDGSQQWDYSIFWQETLKELRTQVSEQEYVMWIRNLQYYSSRENELILSVPSSFYRDQVSQRYLKLIKDTIFDLTGMMIEVSFEIVKMQPPPVEESGESQEHSLQQAVTAGAAGEKGAGKKSQDAGPRDKTVEELPVSDEEDQVLQPQQHPQAMSQSQSQAHTQAGKIPPLRKHPDLKLDYTFSNFVVGENNSFAANACIAIAKNPGTAYNPCLIYGGVGLGKTHLIQSIGNYVYNNMENQRVTYVTAEDFTNEFIQSIPDGKTHHFKNKYRKVDVLLIDDIHFLQGKNQTQEELFHTFNALYESNKQMVFTCDRPVSELKHLTDRLRSRFERGLNVDLQPPNFETRFAILKRKVELVHAPIDDEVIELISKNITTNVRDLEAALTKLIAYSNILNKRITVEIAQEQLKDVFSNPKQSNITIEIIQKAVAEYFNLSPFDLRGKKRTKAITFPRQVAMYITREITEFSTTEVGLEFGGRDHTTVMHACQRIESRMQSDPYLEPTIQRLVRRIKEYGTKS
jgi:chromosomal replication initiator protein